MSLFPLIEQVNDDQVAVEITSRRGDAVLMSRAEYDALRDSARGIDKPDVSGTRWRVPGRAGSTSSIA